jgi:predicted nucleic acid-binding protein
MIVVDSNVIAYLYLATEHSDAAEELMQRDPAWAAPPLWRSELRSVLTGYLRRKSITFEHACRIQEEAENLLESTEFQVSSRAVLQLVKESDCSAYDCEFVALAIELSTKLVTQDRKLLRAFPEYTEALA